MRGMRTLGAALGVIGALCALTLVFIVPPWIFTAGTAQLLGDADLVRFAFPAPPLVVVVGALGSLFLASRHVRRRLRAWGSLATYWRQRLRRTRVIVHL